MISEFLDCRILLGNGVLQPAQCTLQSTGSMLICFGELDDLGRLNVLTANILFHGKNFHVQFHFPHRPWVYGNLI